MKVDFNQVLKDLQGNALKVQEKPDSKEMIELRLKDAAVNVLGFPLAEDKGLSGKESFERLELMRRIYAGGTIELAPEEAALIQNRAPKVYPVLYAGAMYAMLNG